MSFKVGDVVVLKSGSPLMTIEEIDGDVAHVVWMELITKYQNSFATSTLEHSVVELFDQRPNRAGVVINTAVDQLFNNQRG